MKSATRARLIRLLAGMVAAVPLAWLLLSAVRAQEEARSLAPGAEVQGEIRDRFGDRWTVRLCEEDSATVIVRSDAFTPYVEFYAPGDDDPVADATGVGATAELAVGPLEASGVYTIAVSGERRTDRGPYTIQVVAAGSAGAETPDGWIAPGQTITDNVRTRFGDLWQVRVCAGETVTFAVASALEIPVIYVLPLLLPDTPGGPLASAEGSAGVVQLPFEVDASGDYLINIVGLERTDRGPYTLTVSSSAFVAEPVATPTRAPTPTPSRTPTRLPTRTPTRTPTVTPPAMTCTVLVDQLNLREGPGTVYARVGQFGAGALLRALGRNEAATWLRVSEVLAGRQGWVSAAPEYVTCTQPLTGLPIVAAPPPPTPTRTPTSTPTLPAPVVPPTPTRTPTASPTPTLPALVVLPAPSNDVLPGDLYTGAGMAAAIDEDARIITFRGPFYLRLEPGATNPPVDYVVFTVFDLEATTSAPVHVQRENDYAYCLFGGGTPTCNTLGLGSGARWPSTGQPVLNGSYNVVVDVYLEGDEEGSPTGQWFGSIVLDSPNLPAHAQTTTVQPLQAALRETAPGSLDMNLFGPVAFRVAAWDPAVGTQDGAGIATVTLQIYDPNGVLVHERREGTAGYCAFMGGEPDCTIYDYAASGYVWPGGAAVTGGPHLFVAAVRARDGREETWSWTVNIQ